jgi:4-hydroxybenzoate polyprenyltransferase
MTSTSLKILKVLLFADLILLLASIFFGGKVWVYNSQIGFISSALVMVASIISYRRMVNTRVELGMVNLDDDKDIIDKLEDPHDLYSEEITLSEEEQDLVEVVKEEKSKRKENRRTIGQTLRDTKAALSMYRLGAYALLVLGFMYLNHNGLLYIPAYLIALSLPPLIIVIMLMREK